MTSPAPDPTAATPWSIRRASLRDREALTALCRESVGPDDYVLDYLDSLVLRQIVYLAEDPDGRVVGMMAYRPCLDGAGWLGQARTHPRARRQGVATAILSRFAALGRRSGAPALRLWSDATNTGAIVSTAAAGFHEVGRFMRLVAPVARGRLRGVRVGFDEEVWGRVKESWMLARGKGYTAYDWTFLPATRPVVFALAAQGALRGWGENLLAVSPPRSAEDTMGIVPWAGKPSELFAEGCRQASHAGASFAEAFVPTDAGLLKDARRAGFEPGTWGREAVLFELPLGPPPRATRTRPTYGELAARGHAHDALGWARWNG